MKFIGMFLVLGTIAALPLSAEPLTAGSVPAKPEPMVTENLSQPIMMRAWLDTFSTYVYSFGNIIPFSYYDSTQLQIKNEQGTIIWSGTMNADAWKVIITQNGAFFIQGNKRYSILTGDATSSGCTGYFALDQFGLPLSTKFLTFQPLKFVTSGWQSDETFIVFSYQDSTNVVIRNLNSKSILWEGPLNKGGHRSFYPGKLPLIVTANHPVSALSYADQDWWIPSREGNWVGKLFYTWVGRVGSGGGWQNDLNIFPWENNTNIWVTNTQTGDTLWKGNLDAGRVKTVLTSHVYLTIQGDKPISCCITPFFSFTANYYHMQCASDSTGIGIGKTFYCCALANTTSLQDFVLVFAFEDSTQIEITDTRTGSVDWSGMLDAGEYHRHSSRNTMYKITATQPIAVYEIGTNGVQAAGSKFAPLYFVLRPAVTIVPDQSRATYRATPVRYQLLTTNVGNVPDFLNIKLVHNRSQWNLRILDSTGTVQLTDHNSDGMPDVGSIAAHGGSANLWVEVTPADSAPPGEVDTCQAIVLSSTDSSVTDTCYLYTRVIVNASITVVPDQRDSIFNGDSLFYRINVSNHGTDPDLIDIRTAGTRTDWEASLWDTTGTTELEDLNNNGARDVGPVSSFGGVTSLAVKIKSPPTAQAFTIDTTRVIGYSNLILGISDTATLLTEIRARAQILVTPDQVDSVWAGQPVRYRLSVRNDGNGADFINIVPHYGHADWQVTLLDSTGLRSLRDNNSDGIPDVGALPAFGGTTTIWVELVPPPSTRHGTWDTTIVEGQSTLIAGVTSQAMLQTKVLNILPNIKVDPDTAATTPPRTPVTYTMRVTNWGNVPDTVDLFVSGVWNATVMDAADNPLPDRNGNGVPDLGPVPESSAVTFRLKISPDSSIGYIVGAPDSAITNSNVVLGRSFLDTTKTDDARVTTTVIPDLDVHNYPNPFHRGTTNFIFSLPDDGKVSIRIFNRAGEFIKTLLKDAQYPMGIHIRPWDGKNDAGSLVAPGVYLYVFTFTGDGIYTTKYLRTARIDKKAVVIP